MKKNTDILNGSLFKNIFLFALPIAVSCGHEYRLLLINSGSRYFIKRQIWAV